MAETKKYANLESLQTFLNNLKSTFATLSHKHTISDITDYTVDTELSSTSVNPVQNKVLDAEFEAVSTAMGALELAIDEKANTSHTHDDRYYTETEIDSKLANKSDSTHNHTITASASDDDVVVLTGTNGTNKVTYSASHADSGVTAGTYKSVTVNTKGHVIAGSNPTTLEGYGITDVYTKTEMDTALSSKSDTGHTHSLSDINEVEVTTSTETVYERTIIANSNETVANGFLFNKVIGKNTIVTFNGVEYDGEYSFDFESGYDLFRFGDYTISSQVASGVPYLRPTIDGETYEIKVDVIETTTIIPDDYISENIARTSDLNALQTVVAGKADSSTTLEGYGITDAYTKTEVDTAIANSKNTWYATCPTAAATADKVVTTSSGDFALEAGNVVYVQFTYQAVADATLNVDGTGAITIQTVGTSATAAYYWSPNETVGFVYDGTYFRMIDSQIATTTYYGITKLSSSTSSTATNVAATPSAVKSAYDLANAAMPKAGGTFTGATYAQANTSYTTYQLRNIALSTSAATPTGNGSILGVYS